MITINGEYKITQVYEHNNDSPFFVSSSPGRIFLYKKENNSLDTIYQWDESKYRDLKLVCISDRFFIMGQDIFIKNSNRGDLTK